MQQTMTIGPRTFDLSNHTYIMGILNVTPDSFSDGGSYHTIDDALYRVEQMMAQGADIIDVGGESTRPGHVVIGDDEEIHRVSPVIEAITGRFEIPVSIDTYKAPVAMAALESGAHLVNDIWGLQHDSRMAEVIAKYDAACCLMHNQNGTDYDNLVADCVQWLQNSANQALAAGVRREKIMLDPGVGFGKTYQHNLQVLQQLQQYNQLDYPMLLGTSRKSVIGLTLDLPVDQRVEGTLVTTMLAVLAGWSFVRVHDIQANYRTIRMTEAIRDCQGR